MDMPTFDHMTTLLLTAEQASNGGAVTVDLFHGNEEVLSGGALAPIWEGDATPIGRLVAQKGRICWVMAKGRGATLSEILTGETGVPRETLEEIFRTAKAEGIPFCEKLASFDLVEGDSVRRALRNQAGAALASLAWTRNQEELACSIGRIPHLSYDPRFTFDALELLQAAIQQSKELKRDLGRLPFTYARLAPKLQAAICFRESPSGDVPLVPVSCWCRRSIGIGDALDLAYSGLSATQPSDLVASEISPIALISHGNSECWLCSYTEPYLCLFQIDTQAQYLALMESLVAERRPPAKSD
jgi:hypothetical protein